MTKTANLYARIEPELKNEAEQILNGLGVPVSNAINIFYHQIVLHRGLPFAVIMPRHAPRDLAQMDRSEIDAELARGFEDLATGRSRSLSDVQDDLTRDYGL